MEYEEVNLDGQIVKIAVKIPDEIIEKNTIEEELANTLDLSNLFEDKNEQ